VHCAHPIEQIKKEETMLPNRIACGLFWIAAACVCAGSAQAQTLLLTPPRAHVSTRNPFVPNEILTLDLMVDGNVGSAVSWGTDIILDNPGYLQFVSDYGGPNQPFKPLNAFFDVNTSFSPAFTPGDTALHLDYTNFTPGAVLGTDGPVTLGEFQVRVLADPGYPDDYAGWNNGLIELSALDSPPAGSAVQDADGNNLLIGVEGAAITSRPPSPEPAGWLAMTSGTALLLLQIRRRARRPGPRG
jgi:hypothetical protein